MIAQGAPREEVRVAVKKVRPIVLVLVITCDVSTVSKMCHVLHVSLFCPQAEKEDPSPYFEPLVRSLLLGLSCGVIFESLHVALKVQTETIFWL